MLFQRVVSVIKVDSDGASCQDVVCHANSSLLLLPFPLLGRPAGASPAALGAARRLVQRPAHEDAAVQEHLLRWGHSSTVTARLWAPLATGASGTAFLWHAARVPHRRPMPERPLRWFPCVPSPESLAEISEPGVGRQGIGRCGMILQVKG